MGREEVADEAIVELDRVEERRGDWDVAAREFHSDRRAVEMSSRVHVDFSHDTFLRRRRSHGHFLGPANLALARPHEGARAGNQVYECEARLDDLDSRSGGEGKRGGGR